jgi:hypothetical protein
MCAQLHIFSLVRVAFVSKSCQQCIQSSVRARAGNFVCGINAHGELQNARLLCASHAIALQGQRQKCSMERMLCDCLALRKRFADGANVRSIWLPRGKVVISSAAGSGSAAIQLEN